ncbi:ABC transporter ATP-binding protein [Clostridium tagluense]|uniref:ABC transporter ATP-binding protein n=1 Tax=Clostridium tagluense TaxID=360422 RepID=UPI001C6F133E|nr:ABC transporter ATP-binding protein [Clostridium tagluense]MBW9157008.1 ABC transporter ATP-binding protein [Clostridium tagluense]WLC64995.1 ABC transporter ATP-binding protein [Clostridium tagluense]
MKDIVVKINNINKIYKLYDKPIDRLKEALSVTKKIYHREYFALKEISLEVKRGETLGIIGTNGSGKSTLLKILTGVLSATSGEINIKGRISALLELGAGFNMEYTGIENIYLNGAISGYSKEETSKKISSILEFADIGDFINQPVKTYSSGMFVRLAFAVAINVDPDILIIDEALSVGDNIFQSKCYRKFEELKDKGKTILLVTHDVDSVRKFCDRCIWIERGHLKEEGDVKKVTSQYIAYTTKRAMNIEKEKIYVNNNVNIKREKKFTPISRWGSSVGLIKYVTIYNDENEVEYLDKGSGFNLLIEVQITQEILQGSPVGIAFSIKNKKGQDLIVGATFDQNKFLLKEGFYKVSFNMENYLVPGEYYIVASLETRETQTPSYIDYIEGAHYFKVGSNEIYYGMLDVPMKINIDGIS